MHTRRDARAGRVARLLAALVVAGAALVLQGCGSAEPVPDAATPPARANNMQPPPGHGPYTGTVADWPLWFPFHSFGAQCFSVQSCRITYAGHRHGSERPSQSIDSLDVPLHRVLRATHMAIRNFPPPAEVAWTAQDGTELSASVDIAEIFSDRMVHHPVAREDIRENTTIPPPGIILAVDDRTIHVYMSTWISLKELQDPSNPHSALHTGVVLVHSKTY